jgi:regulator of sigma E protease
MAFGSILLAALGIGFLIFVHELGHFLAARAAGVRVEVFSLGFGPRLWGFYWRDTDFRLSLVPFGGYVMVAGQDPSDDRYPARESLWAKSVGQRVWFWSGGVLMNVLFALVAFPIVFGIGVSFTAPVIGRVLTGSAAWEARLAPGDRVLSINGKSLYSFENLLVEAALTGGRPAVLRVADAAGVERTVTAVPHWNAAEGRYELGIGAAAEDELPPIVVAADGPAAAAGLRDGDVLVAVDGKAPRGAELEAVLTTLAEGKPFTATVRNAEGERTVPVTPKPAAEPGPLRIGVGPLPRTIAGWRQGNAFVERLDLRRGDLLLALDGAPFTAGSLAGARTGPDRLHLVVLRDGKEVEIAQPATAADRAGFVDEVALRAEFQLWLHPAAGQPAAAAGLQTGERLVAIDGRDLRSFDDLRRAVERSDGKPLRMTLRAALPRSGDGPWRDPATGDLALGPPRDITLTPRALPAWEPGFVPQLRHREQLVRADGFVDAMRMGFAMSLDLVKQLYVTVKRMVTGDVGAQNLNGIIGISQVSYQAAQRGFAWFAYLLAMLSLNLAFVNLLPIPVLDGGHLMFLLIEKVKGSPVSSRVFGYSQMVGLVFVLMLVLFVTYNDIMKLL